MGTYRAGLKAENRLGVRMASRLGGAGGYLHWLKLEDGSLAARTRAGGEALRATPAVADGVLVVQSIEGELSAYRVQ